MSLRKYIDIIEESLLNEKVERFEIRGRDVLVTINPTRNGTKALIERAKYGLARGFILQNDIYFWDASQAIHHQIWRQLTDVSTNVIPFMFALDLEVLKEDAAREYASPGHYAFIEDPDLGFIYADKSTVGQFMAHPRFQAIFQNAEIFDENS
jgi:hypothetical protein